MQDRPDIVFVGHITRDLLPEGGWRPGGSVVYGAHLAARWGFRPAILTAAVDDAEAAAALPDSAEVICICSEAPTVFSNSQTLPRRQYVRSVAAQITADALPAAWRDLPILLAPVIGEVPATFAREAQLSGPLGVALQGWLRRIGPDGGVSPVDARTIDVSALLTNATVAFASEEDLAATANAGALFDGLERTYVPITDGEQGARVAAPWKKAVAPAPASVVDPTGAGDVFATAFMLGLLLGEDARAAAQLAAAAAAASVEGEGIAALPSLDEARRRMSEVAPV